MMWKKQDRGALSRKKTSSNFKRVQDDVWFEDKQQIYLEKKEVSIHVQIDPNYFGHCEVRKHVLLHMPNLETGRKTSRWFAAFDPEQHDYGNFQQCELLFRVAGQGSIEWEFLLDDSFGRNQAQIKSF